MNYYFRSSLNIFKIMEQLCNFLVIMFIFLIVILAIVLVNWLRLDSEQNELIK